MLYNRKLDGKSFAFGQKIRFVVSVSGGAGSSHENSLSKNWGKVAYILPP